ncbi:MAG: hypothetical protein PHU07_12320 [Acidocella sp.]|nr:hypothetical protein [Acidocella sp.]
MVTDDQYASRMQNPTGWAVRDGTDLVAYTPPAPSLTLAQQAQAGLNNARAYVQSTYLILNEATPDAWVAYIKALMAIANGSDTAATALPAQPAP